jgi:Ankyrin repeats (3 copies)
VHLDKGVIEDSLSLTEYPHVRYAAEHWFEHSRFEGVSQNADERMKQLFHRRSSHLAVRLWILLSFFKSDKPKRHRHPVEPPYVTPHITDELTPLHLASSEGHVEVARFLVDHGAKVTTRDKDGMTQLHHASSRGHAEFTLFLVQHGADTATNEYGSTPLHRASDWEYVTSILHSSPSSMGLTRQPRTNIGGLVTSGIGQWSCGARAVPC